MSAPRSLSKSPVAVRRRSDLRAVETQHKHQSAVVVKDPIAMKYHRLRPDEYFILQQLDGQVSLEELCSRYEQMFPPRRVSPAEMNQLLLRLHQFGLTISDAADQGQRLHERKQKERNRRRLEALGSMLFIRLPGVDPEPLLRRLYPLVRPLFSPAGLVLSAILCLTAASLFTVQWDRFRSELPSMDRWIRIDAILILAAVIGITKILHELGHALVCKHFGGECHQIGPMLMVMTPALYCDTSDTWMLPSRWQRAAVGLAGMATEVLIAAVATLVWLETAPGTVHYVAMNIMIVCGVSTVLFNANPLLRYDGYYVLSDLCDIPNLGEESRRLLASTTCRTLLGVKEDSLDHHAGGARVGMLLYAVLAFCYRWALTLVILWFVSHALRPIGLQSLGVAMCALAALGITVSLLRSPIRFLRHPGRRGRIRRTRSLLTAGLVACLIAVMICPLPAPVTAEGRLVAQRETPVYVTTPGFLEELPRNPGQSVKAGQPIARLINHDVELQYLTAKGRYQTQLEVVQAIRRSSIQHPEAANDLPAQEAALEDLNEQLQLRLRRRNGLILTAAHDGMLIEGPRRSVSTGDPHQLRQWEGYPNDSVNQGCFLNPGDELYSIIVPDQWEAELLLDQTDVQRVRVGDTVKVIVSAAPDQTLRGTVREIAKSEWTAHQNADRRDDHGLKSAETPLMTRYAVRVQLHTLPATAMTGMSVLARIDSRPLSLLQRGTIALNHLFRFRSP